MSDRSTPREPAMSTTTTVSAKEEVIDLLRRLPDNVTFDDIRLHIHVLQQVKTTLDAADGGLYRTRDDSPISAHAEAVIGPNGAARIREFWTYPAGWDFGEGNPLSPVSVALFESFLSVYPDFDRKPSVFLTREGNLALAWEDSAGDRVEVEFAPAGIELYLATSDEESVYGVEKDDLLALAEKIRRHDADAA